MTPVSVVIRTYNSAQTLLACVESVRTQDLPAQVVVVDSGSVDGTLAQARGLADVVVEIPTTDFTYGGALNAGAEAGAGRSLVALSSHCALPRADWLSLAVGHLERGASACCGTPVDGEGVPLTSPLSATHGYLVAHRHWGMSNHASAWSRQAWERHRFSGTLKATEDKEWSWRATLDSGPFVADPRLVVDGGHRRGAGVRSYYARLVKERSALSHIVPLEPYPASAALRDLATPHRRPGISGSRPWGRTRAVEVAAHYRAAQLSRRQAG